jgi:glycosyltransferase involved in cell wall biosynthesis
MKIVHVAEAFAAGIAVFINSLVENMKDDEHIVIHGEREWVMKSEDVKKIFSTPNVRFIRWPSAARSINPLKDFRAFRELCAFLRELQADGQIDAVHLHSSKSGFLGRVACRAMGVKNVIYTPNGAPFLVGETWLSNILYKWLEQVGSWFGGSVVCCSLSELKAYQDLGIKATNINNGIAVRSTLPGRPDVLRVASAKVGSPVKPGPEFRVITSGRIAPQKDPSLFNAIACYFEDWPAFEFIWVGDGEGRPLLTSRNIQVTGWLPRDNARALITGADVYLSTAKFEGLSFAGLEALDLQKPMLLTDCIGNRDLAGKGSNGDLFRSENDAIVKILRYFNNRLMLPIMGMHSKQLCAEEFNVRDTYSQYRELYTGQQAQ